MVNMEVRNRKKKNNTGDESIKDSDSNNTITKEELTISQVLCQPKEISENKKVEDVTTVGNIESAEQRQPEIDLSEENINRAPAFAQKILRMRKYTHAKLETFHVIRLHLFRAALAENGLIDANGRIAIPKGYLKYLFLVGVKFE
jgi:hypothetical protein